MIDQYLFKGDELSRLAVIAALNWFAEKRAFYLRQPT